MMLPNSAILAPVSSLVTQLFLEFNGADNSTTFTDSSTFNHTMTTVVNSAPQSPKNLSGKGVFYGSPGNGQGAWVKTSTMAGFSNKDFEITGTFNASTISPATVNAGEPIIICGYLVWAQLVIGIFSTGDPSAGQQGKLFLKLTEQGNSPTYRCVFNQVVTINVDHTFKATRSNGVLKLFMDGVEAVSGGDTPNIGTSAIQNNTNEFAIGSAEASFYNEFDGTLEDFKVRIAP